MANVPGGWSKQKEATEEIQKICDQVTSDVEKTTGKNYEVFRAVTYRDQIVKGTNYVIKVHIGGSSYIHVKLYEYLPCDGGKVELKGVQENHTIDDPLEPFPPNASSAQ